MIMAEKSQFGGLTWPNMRTRTRLSLHPEMKSRTLLSVTVSTILYGSLRRMNSSTLTVLNCLSYGNKHI